MVESFFNVLNSKAEVNGFKKLFDKKSVQPESFRPLFKLSEQSNSNSAKWNDGEIWNIRANNNSVYSVYNIAKDDTVSDILVALNKGKKDGKITLDDIKKANPHIKDLNKIKDTDFLVIPIPREMQDDADTVNMYFDPKTGECLF